MSDCQSENAWEWAQESNASRALFAPLPQICDLQSEIRRLRAECEKLRAELEAVCKWPMHKKVALHSRYMTDRRLTLKALGDEYGVSASFIGRIIKQVQAQQ